MISTVVEKKTKPPDWQYNNNNANANNNNNKNHNNNFLSSQRRPKQLLVCSDGI